MPLIGISACLGGESVRYDGGHKHQPLILAVMSAHAELRAFCPEMAAGLDVPRPPVQLIGSDSGPVHAKGVENRELDVTSALETAADSFFSNGLQGLSGFILKSRSPSCGLGSTPVHDQSGTVLRLGSGVFADRLARAAPWLPLAEESALDSEQKCLRFLSACAIVGSHRNGLCDHADLEGVLGAALSVATMAPEQRSRTIVARLLASLSMDHEKTALDERLSRYWSEREQ
ncbi:DUF523 domain-containing protein [Proteobacteria bacterium 005FR1]|nr:DUF523 domain-containing protein [Proteobacteria bacterium 005FR1]